MRNNYQYEIKCIKQYAIKQLSNLFEDYGVHSIIQVD